MKLSKDNIELIKEYLKDKPVLKAFVFGSYARGDAQVNSDVDLLVELDYSEKIGLLFVQMQLDLEDLLHKDIDLVSSNGVSPRIRPIIEKEKYLIYAR